LVYQKAPASFQMYAAGRRIESLQRRDRTLAHRDQRYLADRLQELERINHINATARIWTIERGRAQGPACFVRRGKAC
jgi:hypothetical protein